MDKTQKEKAEKLQAKLEKLLETREKKQAAFDKIKRELYAVTKDIDGVKLRLFEILQSGSDDTAFSSWAKRKIDENGKTADSEKAETPDPLNPQTHTGQEQQTHTAQTQYRPDGHTDS